MNDALALIAGIEADLAKVRRDMTTLRRLLDAPEEAEPEEWLPPCEISYRLGIGEAYVRKLIRRGLADGLAGFEKRGGRLSATTDAVKAIWNG